MIWILGFALLLGLLFGRSSWQQRRFSQEVLERGWTIDRRERPGVPDALETVSIRWLNVGPDRAVHHSRLIEGSTADFSFVCFEARSKRLSGKVSESPLGLIVACELPSSASPLPSFDVSARHAVTDVFERMSRELEEQSGFTRQLEGGRFEEAFYLWLKKGDPAPTSAAWQQALLQHPDQLRVGSRHVSFGGAGRWVFLQSASVMRLEELDRFLEALAWWRTVAASAASA